MRVNRAIGEPGKYLRIAPRKRALLFSDLKYEERRMQRDPHPQ